MLALRMLWAAHNEEVWRRRQLRQRNRRRLENIDEMPDVSFQERFRLDKPTFRELCGDLRARTNLRGTNAIPIEVKILCALSFLATGSYQRIVGVTQHLLQRTASRCIRQVVEALNHPSITNKWIVFPLTRQERVKIKQEFQMKFRLPGVIGCIDCTHVAIVKPSHEEHLFFNRKGYHSLNVQMICDSNLKIMNVNSKFGGATHDSHIWAAGQAEPYMRELHRNGEQLWLLGDSGYAQRAWLMTPILNAAEGSREAEYTRRHIQARNCIERCFGVLKSRWRCLLRDRTLHYHHYVASRITTACAVLHNIALHARMPEPDELPPANDDDFVQINNIQNHNDLIQGRAMLNILVNRL
ncbi:unnamed protein product [Plutella xylostella]|uniref:(diamondback moth) hypothetical protein n=1 Tax=Plutella xylostella TaxID=51655 RepID=A0A8S4FV15_PLUXY|nr:unnamed protein product [Plutella xylostella]